MALTTKAIRDIQPREKYFSIGDPKAKGLLLRVAPSGTRTWQVNYLDASRKWRRTNIGTWPTMSLADARAKAAAIHAAVKAGDDPLAERRQRNAAPTMADLWQHFRTHHAPQRISIRRFSARTLKEYGYQYERHVLPALGHALVADVSRSDVEAMLNGSPGPTRNRVLALTSRLFTLAESEGWATGNPCKHVERARETARDRILSPAELQALATALDAMDAKRPRQAGAIRVAAYTGLRISEVLAIRWDDIEPETGRLTIRESKTGRRMAFLPSVALDAITALPRTGVDVFPISYAQTRAAFQQALTAAGIEHATLHDLRRTLATRAAMAGNGTPVIAGMLGHASTRMSERYVRLAAATVNESAEAVGSEIAGLMSG